MVFFSSRFRLSVEGFFELTSQAHFRSRSINQAECLANEIIKKKHFEQKFVDSRHEFGRGFNIFVKVIAIEAFIFILQLV